MNSAHLGLLVHLTLKKMKFVELTPPTALGFQRLARSAIFLSGHWPLANLLPSMTEEYNGVRNAVFSLGSLALLRTQFLK